MRLLLDEALPRRLAREFGSIPVRTVHEMGWAGKRNGELLSLAELEFTTLVTVDRSLPHQQDVTRFDIAIVILTAYNNTLEALAPLVPLALAQLSQLRSGQVLYVPASTTT